MITYTSLGVIILYFLVMNSNNVLTCNSNLPTTSRWCLQTLAQRYHSKQLINYLSISKLFIYLCIHVSMYALSQIHDLQSHKYMLIHDCLFGCNACRLLSAAESLKMTCLTLLTLNLNLYLQPRQQCSIITLSSWLTLEQTLNDLIQPLTTPFNPYPIPINY